MKRRQFTSTLASSGIGLALPGFALAQGGPVEGTHYVKLQTPAPVAAPAGKVEVVEFFWYGCPACNSLEPLLEAWVKKLPPDVQFRRVPVGFMAPHEAHQKLFFALEAMGQLEAMHRRVFATIHTQQQRLVSDKDQIAFVKANGVDGDKFADMLKSFSVQTKAKQASALSAAYKIDGVPTFGIHGRFFTGGSLAGDHQRALAVTEFLIQRVKKGA